MDFIGKMAGKLDRWTGSKSTKLFLNKFLEEYGQILDLDIDSKVKKIRLKILLKGETDYIDAFIHEYYLEESAELHFITIRQAEFNREWLKIVFNKHVKNKRFQIPARVYVLLKSFMD